MEKPEGWMNRRTIICFIIILFHLVGLIGLASPVTRQLFCNFIPGHLILMYLLLAWNHQNKNLYFTIFTVLIFILGFAAEWIGVHTNFVFGHYFYGSSLGPKLSGVPIVMSINWFLIIYCTGNFIQQLPRGSFVVRLLAGALLLVLLDVCIEPVAMRLDYWHWQNNHVPLLNYYCWFLLGFLLLYLMQFYRFSRQGLPPVVLLLSQFLFFIILNIISLT